jgi:alpha-glucosidase
MSDASVPARLGRPGHRAAFALCTLSTIAALGVSAAAATAQVAGKDFGTAELLSPGVARYFAPGAKPEDALPSFALAAPAKATGPAPADFPVRPVFSTAQDGRKVVRIATAPGTSLYGTGEVAGPLLRNGRTVTLWNTDAFGYTVEANPSLYQSHPWVLAVRADGTAFGVLADTTWRTDIALEGGIAFTAEGPEFPVIIIDRPTPQAVVSALADLTGHMPMPPKWAVGYHQCRYSYNPEARVREVAGEFRKRDIPCDVIWFDIDYMDEYRVFTFDKKQFPDPTKLNADLERDGFRTIWMIDPGVKFETGYFVSDQIVAGDYAVKTRSGQNFIGPVWPGDCVFPDYTSDKVRSWWAGLYKDFMATGIDGVWNDMNEPAVFNTPTKTMPEDNLHVGGKWSSGPGQPSVTITPGPHARFHNVYGMLMAQGTLDGIRATNPKVRPFVLTRAGYLGSHRYAATWTGDNSATWTDLEQSVPMVLNLGLSGQPFSGPDIGGFNKNGPDGSTPEEKGVFFARWMGFGALLPFARGHTAKGNIDKEPWSFGPDAELTCRQAIQRRYRLMPYYYTLFREASVNGLPVARPIFFADPTDPALRSEDDAFLLGADVMVLPKMAPHEDRAMALPPLPWRRFNLVGEEANRELPELRIRPGAIVPLGPVMEYTAEKPLDPLTLLVALDSKGKAVGTLYEDAGDGYAYLDGEFLLSTYSATAMPDGTVVVQLAGSEGKMARPARTVRVEVVTADGTVLKGAGDEKAPIVVATR